MERSQPRGRPITRIALECVSADPTIHGQLHSNSVWVVNVLSIIKIMPSPGRIYSAISIPKIMGYLMDNIVSSPSMFSIIAVLHITPCRFVRDFVLSRPEVVSPHPTVCSRKRGSSFLIAIIRMTVQVLPARPAGSARRYIWSVERTNEYIRAFVGQNIEESPVSGPSWWIAWTRVFGPNEPYRAFGLRSWHIWNVAHALLNLGFYHFLIRFPFVLFAGVVRDKTRTETTGKVGVGRIDCSGNQTF